MYCTIIYITSNTTPVCLQKTPFAGADCNSDLGQFYRECQGAPPLCMFNDNASFCETLDSVTEQLSLFDARAKDFDDFVNSLQCPETEAQ